MRTTLMLLISLLSISSLDAFAAKRAPADDCESLTQAAMKRIDEIGMSYGVGASLDRAAEACTKNFTKSERAYYDELDTRCGKAFTREDRGNDAIGLAAFCRLRAAQFVSALGG